MRKLKMLIKNIKFLMNNDLSIKPEEKKKAVPFNEIRFKPSRAEIEARKKVINERKD